jgi:hypothetical protein
VVKFVVLHCVGFTIYHRQLCSYLPRKLHLYWGAKRVQRCQIT